MSDNLVQSSLFCETTIITDWCDENLIENHYKVKLFKIELSHYYDIIELLFITLTPQEVQRAQRYYQTKDSKRFIICRSLLKIIIAQEKGLDISQIYFEKQDNHKPFFPLDRTLFFNVSHAGDFAIIAIGNCELGVDVEYIDLNFKYQDIVPTVFCPEEIEYIKASQRERHAFYKFWTRKEAIVKSIGKGIDEDLNKISVIDGSHTVSSALVCNYKTLRVTSFKLNEKYLGAIAVAKNDALTSAIHFYSNPNKGQIKKRVQSLY